MEVRSITNGGAFVVTDISSKLDGSGLKGVLQVKIDGTNVTLQGSIDNTDFYNIETFTASTLKEITLVPYFRVNGDASGSAATIGSSTVKLMVEDKAFGG